MAPPKLLLLSLLAPLFVPLCTSTDNFTPNQSIKDGDVLISNGNVFAFGFFSPVGSTKRYVGIWYSKIPNQTVVWVANRDQPINDTTGVVSINSDGNIILRSPNQKVPHWFTNFSTAQESNNQVEVRLLDTGNLVLIESDGKRVVWQSFDHPTDTMLPGMKLGLDRKTGMNRVITSWDSPEDPQSGSYSYKIDPRGYPQFFLYVGSTRYWRSGPWPWRLRETPRYLYNFIFIDNQNEITIKHVVGDPSILTRVVVDYSGVMRFLTWVDPELRWAEYWGGPGGANTRCDVYGRCGAYSKCNPNKFDFECDCLPGFVPKSADNWNLREGFDGCVRKSSNHTCLNDDGFMKVPSVRIPDTTFASVRMNMSKIECEKECLKNCLCTAYTVIALGDWENRCLRWHGELVDTQKIEDGFDLYVRVDSTELGDNAMRGAKDFPAKKRIMVTVPTVSIAVLLSLMVMFSYLQRRKRMQTTLAKEHIETRYPDIPIYDLSTLISATSNFSGANKLGEGGFGSVYKGRLRDGQEIAVKRLAQSSRQGVEEFKNEAIAKLQHKNLVKLMGYCIRKDEKLLVYEYMPNKSLDSFLFDQKRSCLDWTRRFEIICGVARGILYLHHDSRLRIVHRDLKTSNILLDAAMNPKISDFGTARIFCGDQIQGYTKRVAGTYGYMSPEYVIFGKFSTKSDVFSFGVIILEIISGKKNTDFKKDRFLNLIGHVWYLWREGKALEIMDQSLAKSCKAWEVLRCIQIGLLCMEHYPKDRPTMVEVVTMLSSDINLSSPTQPAFRFADAHLSLAREVLLSINDTTITMVEGR